MPAQEEEAAEARAKAEMERVALEGQMLALRQKQGAQQEAYTARQEKVKMELEKKRLEREVELQVGGEGRGREGPLCTCAYRLTISARLLIISPPHFGMQRKNASRELKQWEQEERLKAEKVLLEMESAAELEAKLKQEVGGGAHEDACSDP